VRRPILTLVATLAVALLPSGCAEEGTVLVSVGDGAVTVEDLERSAALMGEQGLLQGETREGREQLLERTLQIEVLYQAALAAGVDELPDVQAQVEQAVRDVVISNFLRISFTDYGFSEGELFDYYQDHSAELVSPPQANVRHILSKDRAGAEEVLAELEDGADFTLLAVERSEDRMSGMNGGRLPVVRPDNQVLPPQILEAIFSAEVGKPFGPLESRMGWHVLVVDAFSPGRLLSFDEARQRIVLELLAPEEEVRAYYETHRDEFDRPDAVSLRYILVADREQAFGVTRRAEAGEDFGKIARGVSLDAATRDSGGLIPLLYRGRPLPIFAGTEDARVLEEKAFSLSPGQTSEPFELSRGWAVIRVLEFTPGEESSYEEVRTSVQSKLYETRLREAEQEFYDSLVQELDVTRDEQAVEEYLEGAF
jgi:peptidyl-prolyl cis-trans isomerase C